MNCGGIEIERKYLIRYPSMKTLAAASEHSEIVQTYLVGTDKGRSERVRKRGFEGNWTYTHTVKTALTDISRTEEEIIISEEEYRLLLKRADPGRCPIEKTRYCLPHGTLIFEIDVYPFWTDRAIMEVELENENQTVDLPNEISVIRELTGDRSYTNAAMAVSIPQESI